MAHNENSQQHVELVQEKIFTPEVFSFEPGTAPTDFLYIPLKFPYSSQEWDKIFATLIDLLGSKEYQNWHGAISRLIQALEIEHSQRSNCDDYQPRPVDERVGSILTAIARQASVQPTIFESFCCSFKFLAKEPPYKHLVLEWLDQRAETDEEAPTQTAILSAQIFFGAYDSTWKDS